jgi:valyl-tRNA synthetase|tara:strand:- start:5234 stop:7882 length:2649 start_codon:yes stop_codon:yes gene_type:complete
VTTTSELSKVYDPSKVEDRWYRHWLEKDYFRAVVDPGKKAYTIFIPPPNVTGSLTIGHVLNNTIQDVLVRRARMQDKEACWVPGTDHASIATESKVVRMLAEKGTDKNQIDREEFLGHAWQWKEKYGSLIIEQLKRLGCSCDWSREKFTMDDDYYKAVITAFVKLYEKDNIYRGTRLVNWCPKTKSAISDEEVIYREVEGHLWYFRYPVKDSDEYVTVATTRPETMLGDTAVAVNPDDKRFKSLVGKTVVLPLVGREMPVIADSFVDPEFGTGCVKVTPAHDPNDFEIGTVHDLEKVNIFNDDGTLNENVPQQFQQLDRFEAREKVVKALEELGCVEKVDPYVTSIGYSDRGQVPIEPYLSEQWFMRMSELAKPALEAVRNGDITFHPKHWIKTYEHWMENIQDWCISRQLWWGHRIPVWFHNETGEVYCGVDPPEDEVHWRQDPDVLDTWASSWLWPVGVLGWPDETEDLKYFHPSDDLVTGADIIFFWVARMIMSSLEFRGEVPFKNVYFNGMVRDMQGRKMSKSLGNSPDPLAIIDKYGADALRYGIMLIAPQGLDILFSEQRVEVGRNFMNKLWNASRFVIMSQPGRVATPLSEIDGAALELADRWMLSRLNNTISEINGMFDDYRFNEIAKRIYDLTWSDFCDWYVEIIKSRLYGEDEMQQNVAFSLAVHLVENILKLLHPFAPFISEEIWQRLSKVRRGTESVPDLVIAEWPRADSSLIDEKSEKVFASLQEVVTGIRTVRAEMKVPPGLKSNLLARGEDGQLLLSNEAIIRDLAKIDQLTIGTDVDRPLHSATVIIGRLELFIPLEGLIDVEKEKQRLSQEMERLSGIVENVKSKLKNSSFVNKAPEEIVQKERQKLEDIQTNLSKLKENLSMLS